MVNFIISFFVDACHMRFAAPLSFGFFDSSFYVYTSDNEFFSFPVDSIHSFHIYQQAGPGAM